MSNRRMRFSSWKVFTTDAVHDASLCVYPGEIVGIAGLLGSGRTELLKALFGCDRIRAGRIEVEGKKVFIRSPSDAQDAGIALAPEDRRRQGLILDFSIEQNIVLPALKRISRGLLLDEGKSGKMADSMIAHLGRQGKEPTTDGPLSVGREPAERSLWPNVFRAMPRYFSSTIPPLALISIRSMKS